MQQQISRHAETQSTGFYTLVPVEAKKEDAMLGTLKPLPPKAIGCGFPPKLEDITDSHESVLSCESSKPEVYTPYTPSQLVGALQDVAHKRKVGKITTVKVLKRSGKK